VAKLSKTGAITNASAENGPISRARFRRLHSGGENKCSMGVAGTKNCYIVSPVTCVKSLVLTARSGESMVACYNTERTGHFKGFV
jgi:hypothetical protein